MYKKIIKTINENKELVIICIVAVLVVVVLKLRKENFKTISKNNTEEKKVYTGIHATRSIDTEILKIEKAHKCNRAGCATRETKQKKGIY